MRVLAASVIGIACFPLFSQDQPDKREHSACAIVRNVKPTMLKCQSSTDPRPEAQAFARNGHVGDPWWPCCAPATITTTLAADTIKSNLGDTTLDGHVEINTTEIILEADGAVVHWTTGEIEAVGKVRVKPARIP